MNIHTIQNAVFEELLNTNRIILNKIDELNNNIKKVNMSTKYNNIPISTDQNNVPVYENHNSTNKDNIIINDINNNLINQSINKLDLLNINNLVEAILNNSFDISMLKLNYIPLIFNEEYNNHRTGDYLEEFRQVITNIISNYFLYNEINIYNFLELVINTFFNKSINYYLSNKKNLSVQLKEDSIKFIYKGGNALRSFFRRYLTDFPSTVSNEIYNKFDNAFSKTDADFQICIDINLPDNDFNIIHKDMENLSYLLLNRIRNIFLLFVNEYFSFYNMNKMEMDNILNASLQELNLKSQNIVDNPFEKINILNLRINNYTCGTDFNQFNFVNQNDVYIDQSNKIDREKFIYDWNNYVNNPFRSDLIITRENDNNVVYRMSKIHEIMNLDEKLLYDKQISNNIYSKIKNSEFYITYNNSVESFGSGGRLNKFSLLRIKVNFSSIFEKNNKYGLINIPGELIDICIPAKYSEHYARIFNFYNPLPKYSFIGLYDNLKNKTFDFYSYSQDLLFDDLTIILTTSSKILWENPKYEKRLNRLYALVTLQLFYNKNLNFNKINTIINEIINCLNNYENYNTEQISNNLKNYLNNNNDDIYLNKLVSMIINMLNDSNFISKIKNSSFATNYLKFFQDLINMLNYIVHINLQFNNYKISDNLNYLVDKLSIINQLGGNIYLHKYLKYKNKYLTLKYKNL